MQTNRREKHTTNTSKSKRKYDKESSYITRCGKWANSMQIGVSCGFNMDELDMDQKLIG